MDYVMKCMNCSEKLRANIISLRPITTSCGHGICYGCVKKAGRRNENRVRCGECKQMSTFAVREKAVVDFSVKDILEDHGKTFRHYGRCITECSICYFPMSTDLGMVPRILPCGHSFCPGCIKHSNPGETETLKCPRCRAIAPKHNPPINWLLYEFLASCKTIYPMCEVHPGYFKFFVCETSPCDAHLMCYKCTEDAPHSGHFYSHVKQFAKILRGTIFNNLQAVRKRALQYDTDSKTFCEIGKTFSRTHPDYDSITKLVKLHYLDSPGCDLEKKETAKIDEFCMRKKEILEEQSIERLKLYMEETKEAFRLSSLSNSTDVELIRNRDQCELEREILPAISFEDERLLNFHTWNQDTEPMKYFLIIVNLENQGADVIYMRLIGWMQLYGLKHGIKTHFNEENVMFTRKEKKYRLVSIRSDKSESEKPHGPCTFSLVYCSERLDVWITDGRFKINRKKTLASPIYLSWFVELLTDPERLARSDFTY